MKQASTIIAAAIWMVCTSMNLGVARAAEVNVISTNAMRPIVTELAKRFEAKTGTKVTMTFTNSPFGFPKQLGSQARYDVAVTVKSEIDAMNKSGLFKQGASANLARTGIGIAVRKGAEKPRSDSVGAFRDTLLKAKSIAFATEGRSGKHVLALFEKYGLMQDIKSKLRPLTTPTSIAAISKGDVEIGILPIPGILAASGVELAAALPTEAQLFLDFSGAVVATTINADSAIAFLRQMASKDADSVMKDKGFSRF